MRVCETINLVGYTKKKAKQLNCIYNNQSEFLIIWLLPPHLLSNSPVCQLVPLYLDDPCRRAGPLIQTQA